MGGRRGHHRPRARRPTAAPSSPARRVAHRPRVASPGPLGPAPLAPPARAAAGVPRAFGDRSSDARAAGVLGAAYPHPHGLLRAPGGGGGDRVPRRPAGVGDTALSIARSYDIVIIGSGAGGGTVAAELAPLVRDGLRVLGLEQGPRFADADFTGRQLELAEALDQDGGAFLTREGTLTLAFASAYGGSTAVYPGPSLTAPERGIRHSSVAGLGPADPCRPSAD